MTYRYRTIVADPPWRYGSSIPPSEVYEEFVHAPPPGIGEWLRLRREGAGMTRKDVAAHFPSRTGGLTGCVTNWEQEFNRPTPEQWRHLRRIIGFDERYDEAMTAQRSVVRRDPLGRGHAERHYHTMSVSEVCEVSVAEFAADDAHLWLWGVNALMEEAHQVVRAWGFEAKTILTWCKKQPGVGYYLRNNTEHCVFATRGEPMVPEHKPTSSWFVWPKGEHSAKPDAFYDLVEQVSPGPYLELFARRARFGWSYWGDESLGTAEVAA